MISDHHPVHCKLNTLKPPVPKVDLTFRKYKDISISKLVEDITAAFSCVSPTINKLQLYNTTLRDIINKHATVQRKLITLRPRSPWITQEVKDAKNERRKLERQWRASRNNAT
jgi:septation ring formation regulator EzrA